MSEVIFNLGLRREMLKWFPSSLWTVFGKLSALSKKENQLLLIPAKKTGS